MSPRPLFKTGDLVVLRTEVGQDQDEYLIVINVLNYNYIVCDNRYTCWSFKRSAMIPAIERNIRRIEA
jgi:hypothetical protein